MVRTARSGSPAWGRWCSQCQRVRHAEAGLSARDGALADIANADRVCQRQRLQLEACWSAHHTLASTCSSYCCYPSTLWSGGSSFHQDTTQKSPGVPCKVTVNAVSRVYPTYWLHSPGTIIFSRSKHPWKIQRIENLFTDWWVKLHRSVGVLASHTLHFPINVF